MRSICYHRPTVDGVKTSNVRSLSIGGAPCWQALCCAALAPVLVLTLAHCDDGESDPVVEPEPPPMGHGGPNEAARQMCVVCHTCGTDGTIDDPAPIIDRTHDVCNSCHAPDGSVIIHGEESCEWDMDCQAVPPVINCDECHTVEYVNDLCEECHAPGSV